MIFKETAISGCFEIEIEAHSDDRGYFARTFCQEEFKARGLVSDFIQESVSFNKVKGTFRGMHFQKSPSEETKVVRCQQGRVVDLILDLRKQSTSYMQWVSVDLSAEKKNSVYIPAGCAHGFYTLEDNSEVFYMIDVPYVRELASGVRYNDPSFPIKLPGPIEMMASKDLEFPLYES